MKYIQNLLESEKGELMTLDHEVLESLQRHETLSSNVNVEFEADLTLGGKMADGPVSFERENNMVDMGKTNDELA